MGERDERATKYNPDPLLRYQLGRLGIYNGRLFRVDEYVKVQLILPKKTINLGDRGVAEEAGRLLAHDVAVFAGNLYPKTKYRPVPLQSGAIVYGYSIQGQKGELDIAHIEIPVGARVVTLRWPLSFTTPTEEQDAFITKYTKKIAEVIPLALL